jgi:hypothetical protein
MSISSVEATIDLRANTVEPDLLVYPKGVKLEEVGAVTFCWRSKQRAGLASMRNMASPIGVRARR